MEYVQYETFASFGTLSRVKENVAPLQPLFFLDFKKTNKKKKKDLGLGFWVFFNGDFKCGWLKMMMMMIRKGYR